MPFSTARIHPAAIALAGFLTAMGFAQQVMAVGQNASSEVNDHVQSAVLAVNAANYCTGMPYSPAEAQAFVERVRYDQAASDLFDELTAQYAGQYRLALTGAGHETLCSQAAQIDLSWFA
jgi:hypothetical protein